jgi:hypothetical protein
MIIVEEVPRRRLVRESGGVGALDGTARTMVIKYSSMLGVSQQEKC